MSNDNSSNNQTSQSQSTSTSSAQTTATQSSSTVRELVSINTSSDVTMFKGHSQDLSSAKSKGGA